jgi:hypothetical protein
MAARIFKLARNAMQSGKGKSVFWVLEHVADAARTVAPEPPVRSQKKSYSDNFRFGRSENWTH